MMETNERIFPMAVPGPEKLQLSGEITVEADVEMTEIAAPKLERMQSECALVSALVDAGLLRSDIYFAALNLMASGDYNNVDAQSA